MRFSSLGSGSKGNATLIEAAETCVMVDCGFSIKETEKRLARLNKTAEDIDAILVTHEHGDHIQGVCGFARRHQVPVCLTPGTFESSAFQRKCEPGYPEIRYIDSHSAFELKALQISPFPVPHDAQEPCQFVFSDGNTKIAILTDTGSETVHISEMLSGVDALLLEFNHDIEMLWQGRYPHHLKERVAGDYGHMSNAQSAMLLKGMDTSHLQIIVAMHLSADNNSPDRVYQELEDALGFGHCSMEIADQQTGIAWRCIDT